MSILSFWNLPRQMEAIMSELNNLAVVINELNAKLLFVRDEIIGKIQSLEDSLANVAVPQEVTAAIEQMRATVMALDNIVPDAPVVEPLVVEPPVVEPPVVESSTGEAGSGEGSA